MDFQAAFDRDVRRALREVADKQLIDDGRQAEVLVSCSGLPATSAQWSTPRGEVAIGQYGHLQSTVPAGSAVVVDTTGVVSAAAITVAPEPHVPSAVSLLDLGVLLNTAVFNDRVLHLGPIWTPWCGNLGSYLNERLKDEVFVSIADPDGATPGGDGLALGQLFDEAAVELSQIFGRPSYRESTPSISKAERKRLRRTWGKVIGSRKLPSAADLYNPELATGAWRSQSSGYGAWLVDRLRMSDDADLTEGDLDAFDLWLGRTDLASIVTEVHLRALFNSTLAFYVLQRPYRASTIRQPWTTLLGPRIEAVERLLAIEELFEETVRMRRTAFQRPPKSVLLVPSVLSIALRESARPEAVWHVAGQIREDLARFRASQSELIRVLTAGDDAADQAKACDLLAALQDGVPRSLVNDVADTVHLGFSIAPRLAAAPTGASTANLMTTIAGAARSSGRLQRLVRRLLQPELHVLSTLSTDAGTALASLDNAARIWGLDPDKAAELRGRLDRLAS